MGPIGHAAVAFALKPKAGRAPLWALLVAAEASDLLYSIFKVVGLDRAGKNTMGFRSGMKILSPGSMPWSHGLLMNVVWSLAAAGIALLWRRDRRAAVAMGVAVFSHWVLDFIVHPPDLPLLLHGSPQVGLGMWSSGPGLIASLVLELAMLAAGIVIYSRSRRNKAGTSKTG